MSKEICTVCGGRLEEGYCTDRHSAATAFVVSDGDEMTKAKRLMVCKDCGLLYAKEQDDD